MRSTCHTQHTTHTILAGTTYQTLHQARPHSARNQPQLAHTHTRQKQTRTWRTAETPAPTPDDTISRQCSGSAPPPPARGGSWDSVALPQAAVLLLLRSRRTGVNTAHSGLRTRANFDRCGRPTDVAPPSSVPPAPNKWCATAMTTPSGSRLLALSPSSPLPDPCQGICTEEPSASTPDALPVLATVMVAASRSEAARATCRMSGQSQSRSRPVRSPTGTIIYVYDHVYMYTHQRETTDRMHRHSEDSQRETICTHIINAKYNICIM